MPTVLISGANRGIGLEFARQYAADGWRVIAGARDPEAATELNALSGAVEVHRLDVADDASVAALKAAVGEAPIDLVLANAGTIGPQEQQSPDALDFAGWLEAVNVNTLGPARLASAFGANLKAGREKKFVAITSGMGSTSESSGGWFAYRSSKAALNNVVRNLSLAWRDDGIVCVALNPGWVKTSMGGPSARITPEKSVSEMRRRIGAYRMKDSGCFLSWDGETFGW